MTLSALQHLIRSAQALAEERSVLVLGSASLLASFPDLGDPQGPLASTFDADICPEPFDELTAIMLDEALGEDRAYYRIHGYHADILRDSILETLPAGWRERLRWRRSGNHDAVNQPVSPGHAHGCVLGQLLGVVRAATAS